MKKIGITMRYIYENGVKKEFVNSDYLNYIKPYFTPILLPIETEIDELLKLCDCFLVTGGADIDPSFYKEDKDPTTSGIEYDMDLTDKTVIEYAYKNKKPLLGICRGLQGLNVFLGGSLIQNIEGDTHKHFTDDEPMEVLPNNFFGNNLPVNFKINSYHHQAIKKLSPHLIACGYSNGIIEAVQSKDNNLIAVQWHPEKLMNNESIKIIKAFRDMVYER